MRCHELSLQQLEKAHKAFLEHEVRDIFYRAAHALVDLSLTNTAPLKPAEAIAVLLQSWNKAYYQYRKFDTEHLAKFEHVLNDRLPEIAAFRKRTIESLTAADESLIMEIFKQFEAVLGPVGAAKCLHILAPAFFPLWDRAIAKSYGLGLAVSKTGGNARRYFDFMGCSKQQIERLVGEKAIGRNPLKAIDEYNYCKFTKEWI